MAPSKLSDTDKQQITKLYCQPGETTSTLASKFGVSSSTVSRVLRQQLSDEDYAQLMQWKRSGERGQLELSYQETPAVPAAVEADTPSESDTPTEAELPAAETSSKEESSPDEPDVPDEPEQPTEVSEEQEEVGQVKQSDVETTRKAAPVSSRRSRRRSTAPPVTKEFNPEEQLPLQLESSETESVAESAAPPTSVVEDLPEEEQDDDLADDDVAAEWVADDLNGSDDDYDDDDYDDDDDLDDDDDDPEDWSNDTDNSRHVSSSSQRSQMQVLPFETLVLKRPCYLVVDRLSELITCPLREFAELGLIPEEEGQARTLPIFDNHRVARRFSRRNQRIVKVPDGMMLTKTQHYLYAKGITRILFDGQVYALS